MTISCAIMQPTFIPWIGYFDLMDQVDRFVFLDDVKVVPRSWAVRNKMKLNGLERFLTVPIKRGTNISFCHCEIDYRSSWRSKHLNSLYHGYCKARHFQEVYTVVERIISEEHRSLASLNTCLIRQIARLMGLRTEVLSSSNLPETQGVKDEKLFDLAQKVSADVYVAARGSYSYINRNNCDGFFYGRHIALRYHDYRHPRYQQVGSPFISHLSVIDLLMAAGFTGALPVVRSGRLPSLPSSLISSGSSS